MYTARDGRDQGVIILLSMMRNDGPRRILVMDEDPSAMELARTILEPEGHEVVLVRGGRAALEMARDELFHAFLLDLDDPEIGGAALCRSIRAEPGYSLTPLLTITASDDRDCWREAYQAGCDDVLRKPLEPVVVCARMNNLMQKSAYAQELERVRANLARYVSPRIRQLLQAAAPGDGMPAPVKQTACILFSDIRGFTAMAQTIPADSLFATVSRQLGAQVESVYAHGGYVDKFGGDGIMAVFDGDNMASNACACALDIMQFSSEFAGDNHIGEDDIPLGIGIHMGPVVAGNIGNGDHLDYTVIGNTVNLAARLCGFAQPMRIVVSEAVRRAVRNQADMRCVEPQEASIRGLTDAVTLYRLERSRSRQSRRAVQG